MVELECTTADTITAAIREWCTEFKVDLNKCHLGSDGARTFSGRLNGVAVQLQQDHPGMQWVHCVAHREALAAADAMKSVDYLKTVAEPTIAGIYRHFSNSPVKEARLHRMQELVDDPHLKLKEPSATRWLSHAFAVSACRKSFASIVIELERQATEQHDMAAKGWVKKVKTFRFAATLLLMSDVLPILVRLSKTFQRRQIIYSDVSPALSTARLSLQQLEQEDGEYLQSIPTFLANLKAKGVDLLGNNNVEELTEQFRRNLAVPYLQALLAALTDRFPLLPVMDALSIFQPALCPLANSPDLSSYGNEKLALLLGASGVFDGDHPSLRRIEAKQEWRALKSMMSDSMSKTSDVQVFITTLYETGQADTLPNLMYLANWGLAIPVTSVECERDFSRLKLVKTRLRNRLGAVNLSRLLRVSINGPDVTEFPFEDALVEWHNQQKHRLPEGILVKQRRRTIDEPKAASAGRSVPEEDEARMASAEAAASKPTSDMHPTKPRTTSLSARLGPKAPVSQAKPHVVQSAMPRAGKSAKQTTLCFTTRKVTAQVENSPVQPSLAPPSSASSLPQTPASCSTPPSLRASQSPVATSSSGKSSCFFCSTKLPVLLRQCHSCERHYHHMCQSKDEEGKLCNDCFSRV